MKKWYTPAERIPDRDDQIIAVWYDGQVTYHNRCPNLAMDMLKLWRFLPTPEEATEEAELESLPLSKELPPICRETMTMEISEQIQVTLFPEKQGQPSVDVIQLDLTQIEGNKISVFLTPCEALEVAAALSTAVQFYLYNQGQYRKEVLEPRKIIADQRKKNENRDYE